MKKCNTEIMKDIKKLEEIKENLRANESQNCTVTYLQKETPIDTGYDYKKTSEELKKCDQEIRRLKTILANVNATVIVEGFDMTINEALIYLAQLNEDLKRLNNLITINPLSRRSSYDGVPEFTKITFNREEVKNDYETVRNLIPNLQMAIDRTNLTHFTEC